MTPDARRRRWPRRLRGILTVALIGGLLVALATRTASPVGHWTSTAAREDFVRAYDRAFRDLPRPELTRDVRTDYGIVRVYRFAGSGPDRYPLVLLPGRASASPVWADNLPSLLEIGDVYTIDLLGEPGRSVQDRPIEDDADQAAWLDQVLDALPEEKVDLVGLSIGGWTAANLAAHRDRHIRTLTLIDPPFVFDDMPLETIVRSIPASIPWLPRAWRDAFTSYTAGGAPVEDVPVADMIEAGMRGYALQLPTPSRPDRAELARIDVPVLAVFAGRSVMLDATTAAATARASLSDVRVTTFPRATHAINGEYPDELAAAIRDFVLP